MNSLIKLFTDILKNKQVKANPELAKKVYWKIQEGKITKQTEFWKEMLTAFQIGASGSGISILKGIAIDNIKWRNKKKAYEEFIQKNFTVNEINKIKNEHDLNNMIDKKYKRLYELRAQKIDDIKENIKNSSNQVFSIVDSVSLLNPESFNRKSLDNKLELFNEAVEEYKKVNTKNKRRDYITDNLDTTKANSDLSDEDKSAYNESKELQSQMTYKEYVFSLYKEHIKNITNEFKFSKKQEKKIITNFKEDSFNYNNYNAGDTLKRLKADRAKAKNKQQIINSIVANGGWKKLGNKIIKGTNKKVIKKDKQYRKDNNLPKRKKETKLRKKVRKVIKKSF